MSTPDPKLRDAESDALLLQRIQRDDPGAFEQFVQSYGDRIFGFGMRVCGEPEDARDVSQETLIQAFRSLKQLRQPRALRSWLYRVVSNACLMKRRKKVGEPSRELSLDELMPSGPDEARLEIPDSADLPDRAAERDEVRRAVRGAIDALPVDYRIVIVLRDMEQLSTKETAEALGLPETTIKMRLHRARLAVRQALAAAVESGELAGGSA
jgi:RNA polymerase sigma-70 factor (ECF subfamily)